MGVFGTCVGMSLKTDTPRGVSPLAIAERGPQDMDPPGNSPQPMLAANTILNGLGVFSLGTPLGDTVAILGIEYGWMHGGHKVSAPPSSLPDSPCDPREVCL